MRYLSTRGGVSPLSFPEAVMMGLAEDGGLLVPEHLPDFSSRLQELEDLDYPALAVELLRPFAQDVPLQSLVQAAYHPSTYLGPVAPVTRLGQRFLLELFHGPTLAFKDVALQLLGRLFEHILAQRGASLNILAATSGDTGSAAIHAVRARRGIQIFVMHPQGRVSRVQQLQMTSVLDPNVHNLAISGSFDDCQRLMKGLSCDLPFKRRYRLGAVNSVNWARVLAQMVYFFWAYAQVHRQTGAERVTFCVPTGNFGDVLAGWYARQMGLPVARLVVATNSNDILARFFGTGVYSVGPVQATLAPAMDIQVASNFERYLYYRLGGDGQRVAAAMQTFSREGRLEVAGDDPLWLAGSADRAAILSTIRRCWEGEGVLLDPHTAAGVAVADQLGLPDTEPLVCLATAHPAKFPEAILEATGQDLAHHPRLDALAGLPTRCQVLADDPQALRDFIAAAAAAGDTPPGR